MAYSKNPVVTGLSKLQSLDPNISLDGIDAIEAQTRPEISFPGNFDGAYAFLVKIGTVLANDLLWAVGYKPVLLFEVKNRGDLCPLASHSEAKVSGWEQVEVKYPPLAPVQGVDGDKIVAIKSFLDREAPSLPYWSGKELNRVLRQWPQDAKQAFLGVASRGYGLFINGCAPQWGTPSDRAVAEALVASASPPRTYTVHGVDSWPISEDPEDGWESKRWTVTYRIW